MDHSYAAFARTYDLEYGRLRTDVPFYVSLAQECGGPALELAVGTGRVAMEVARAGVPVVGLDLERAMLDRCREKLAAEPELPLTLVEADMRDFDVAEHGPFSLIYCPARAFLHLTEVADQLRCLARVRAHLAPGGRFAGNILFPRVDILHRRQDRARIWAHEDEYVDPASGHRVHVTDMTHADTARQQIRVRNRYESVDEEDRLVGTEFRDLHLTYLWPRELEHLFHRAGFELIELYGDFDRNPFPAPCGEMVWIATRRECS